jgi:hypothetical protein
VHGADLTEPFAQLLALDLAVPFQTDSNAITNAVTDLPGNSAALGGNPRATRRRARLARRRPPHAPSATLVGVQPPDVIERPYGPLPTEVQNPGQSRGRGSNVHTLVELRGIEPLTFSMRTPGTAVNRGRFCSSLGHWWLPRASVGRCRCCTSLLYSSPSPVAGDQPGSDRTD